MTSDNASALNEALLDFLPQFYRLINPIVNTSEYEGRRLTEHQIKVIMLLSLRGASSPGEISQALNIQKGNLTGVLKVLMASGLVARRKDEGDERSYRVFLTAAGEEFVRLHRQASHVKLSELFSAMAEPDRKLAEQGLRIVTTYLKSEGNDNERS